MDILLATWNGEAWLPQQLESLLGQSDSRARILIRDDGSTDGTRAVLANWAARYPDRISLLPDDGQRRGACGNFAALLAASSAPRVMFCDQDDHWHHDKVAVSAAAMDRLEAQHGPTLPLLIHGDAQVVDAALQPLGHTLSQAIHVDLATAGDLRRQLPQNAATGCTMILNRALVDACLPVPSSAIMHDWWVALVASAIGEVAVLPDVLIDYRQHQANAIGAGGMRLGRLFARFAGRGAVATRFVQAATQAQALLDRHSAVMTPERRHLCAVFAALPMRGWFGRRAVVVRHGFWMRGGLRNAGMLAFL